MSFLYDFHEVDKTTNQAPKQKLISMTKSQMK